MMRSLWKPDYSSKRMSVTEVLYVTIRKKFLANSPLRITRILVSLLPILFREQVKFLARGFLSDPKAECER